MTRPEAVAVLAAQVAVLGAIAWVHRFSPGKLWSLLVALGTFFLVFSPYMVLLHDLTGSWQLTGKSSVALVDGLGEYLQAPDLKFDPGFQNLGYLDLVQRYPRYLFLNSLKNSRQAWGEMLPIYGWMLAAVGLIAGAATKERAAERCFLLGTFAPLAVIIVFFYIGPEYTQEYLPVLFLFIANALFHLVQWAERAPWLGKLATLARYGWYLPLLLGICYGSFMVLRSVPANRDQPYYHTQDDGRYDEKQIGQKLDRTLPASAVLMTRSGRIGFYSGRRYVLPPQSWDELVDTARKNKVDYLVASALMYNSRPQLEFLFDPILSPLRQRALPNELELVRVDQLPGGLPYILYRFRL